MNIQSPPARRGSANVDPITRDVFQRALVGIAEEMSMALRRAAFSSIIWDMYDYACGLFTPDGEMMAQAKTIPAQLGIMSTALKHVRRRSRSTPGSPAT